jgi:hypothetical protein
MKMTAMSKMAAVIGILSLAVAVVVFVFAEGPRRWYSGSFFVIIGAVMLANAIRWRRG